MNWFYERGGASVGPVTEEEFHRLATVGTISPETLVWRDGMVDWLPHATVLAPGANPVGSSAATAVASAALVESDAATKCQVCGASFAASEVVTIAGASVCAKCKPLRLQMLEEGATVLPGTVWRSGRAIVAPRLAELPERCVMCNTTENLQRMKRKLYWHHPAVYLLLFLWLILYVIVALVVRKTADVEVLICRADASRRRKRIILAWVLWLLALATIPVLAARGVPGWVWVLEPLLVIAAVVYSLRARLIYAQRIDERHVWIRGVCAPFLAQFPEWTGK